MKQSSSDIGITCVCPLGGKAANRLIRFHFCTTKEAQASTDWSVSTLSIFCKSENVPNNNSSFICFGFLGWSDIKNQVVVYQWNGQCIWAFKYLKFVIFSNPLEFCWTSGWGNWTRPTPSGPHLPFWKPNCQKFGSISVLHKCVPLENKLIVTIYAHAKKSNHFITKRKLLHMYFLSILPHSNFAKNNIQNFHPWPSLKVFLNHNIW